MSDPRRDPGSTEASAGDAKTLVRAALAVYAALFAAVALWGLRMDVPLWMFQFLPETGLRDRYWESLYFLHSQPPLMNALVGGAIQLERWSGLPKESTLLFVHLLIGSVIVRAFARLAIDLLRRTWLRSLAIAGLLLNPCFWLALFQAFYPIYELLCLVLIASAAQRFLVARRTPSFVACCVWASALVLTRSLFHPLWAVVALGWIGRGAWSRREIRRCAVVVLVTLCAWPAKNLLEFGFLGVSSWLGYHVARGLEVERPELAAAFDLGAAPAQVRARELAGRQVPDRYRDVGVLADPLKWSDRPEIPNLNHFTMIAVARTLLQRAAAAIRDDPSAVATKASACYRRGFCLYPARSANTGKLDPRVLGTWLEPWTRLHEVVSVLYVGDDAVERPATGFRILFPILLVAVLWRLVRERRHDAAWSVVVLLLWHVLWVLAMVLLIDGLEGNRMRFSTAPLLLLSVSWAVEGLLDRTSGTRSPEPQRSPP